MEAAETLNPTFNREAVYGRRKEFRSAYQDKEIRVAAVTDNSIVVLVIGDGTHDVYNVEITKAGS